MTRRENRDGEAIHADPEYKPLAEILTDIQNRFIAVDPVDLSYWIDQVIPYDVLTHAAQHHIALIGPQYINASIGRAAYLPMARLFMDGFLAGAKLQSMRDANIGNLSIPDTPGDLAA